VGRCDDALGHLTEVCDLAQRSDNRWIAAMSQVSLGTLALVRGRAEEARALLDEALGLSLAARSTRSVTLCLAALARWALVAGDPERAALVAGGGGGPRRRGGVATGARPRACAAGPGCERGRCCGRERPSLWPRSVKRSALTISTRCPPPSHGSPSGTRWPLPGPTRRQHLANGCNTRTPGRPPPARAGTSRGQGVRWPEAAFGRL